MWTKKDDISWELAHQVKRFETFAMDLGEKRNSLEKSIPEGAIAGMNNLKDGLQERMNLHSILRTDLSSIWRSVCRLLCLVLSGPGQCWHYHYLTRSIST